MNEASTRPMPLTPVVDLVGVVTDPDRIKALQPGAVFTLLGQLEVLRAQLWLQLVQQHAHAFSVGRDERDRQPDRLLSPSEAAVMLGVTISWLHRHHRQLPFARKLSRKTLRFSELGLRRWLAQQKRP